MILIARNFLYFGSVDRAAGKATVDQKTMDATYRRVFAVILRYFIKLWWRLEDMRKTRAKS